MQDQTKPVTANADTVIKLPGGVVVPVARWFLAPATLLALLALGAYAGRTWALPFVDDVRSRLDSEVQQEQGSKHYASMEEAKVLYDYAKAQEKPASLAGLKILYYADGWLSLVHHSTARWVTMQSTTDKAPGQALQQREFEALPWEGIAEAQAPAGDPQQRRCAKHAGSFRQWEGEKQGCWQQKFREWPDGCRHYQWFNTCSNVWDVDTDGVPRLYWTVCKH